MNYFYSKILSNFLGSLHYRIQVRHFTIFYVVIEDVMEVRRVLYSRRDWKHKI